MNSPFSAIQQSKVSENIAEQIKRLIREGRLRPGEKLPSERELVRLLRVGRSSLREAISSLSMMGLVEVKRRRGIYVRTVSTPLVSDPLRRWMEDDQQVVVNLYDIRMDIEVAAAAAAAENRTDGQLADIHRILERMGGADGQNRYTSEADLQFHISIAGATGNFLRVHIIKEIFDLTGDHLKSALAEIETAPENTRILSEQHATIYAAIADRKSARAGRAMQAHLAWVRSRLGIGH